MAYFFMKKIKNVFLLPLYFCESKYGGSDLHTISVSRKHDPMDIGLIGGKVEPNETPYQAIVRESKEESGLTLLQDNNFISLSSYQSGDTLTYIAILGTSYGEKLHEKYKKDFINDEMCILRSVPMIDLTCEYNTYSHYNTKLYEFVLQNWGKNWDYKI